MESNFIKTIKTLTMCLVIIFLSVTLFLFLFVRIVLKTNGNSRPPVINNFNHPILENDYFGKIDIDIPIYRNFVPQGLAMAKGKILISAYDYDEYESSIIYVIDKNNNITNTCSLNSKSHVGGIGYDETNSLLWVTGENGYIDAYNITDVLTKSDAYHVFETFVGEDMIDYRDPKKFLASSLAIKDDTLYIGSFSLKNRGIMKMYEITKLNGSVSLNFKESVRIPDKVQGIAFYTHSNKDYILFSISYGRKNKSYIELFEYDERGYYESMNAVYSYILPPLLEQIAIADDFIYALFESNAFAYSDCLDKTEQLKIIELNEIIRI